MDLKTNLLLSPTVKKIKIGEHLSKLRVDKINQINLTARMCTLESH